MYSRKGSVLTDTELTFNKTEYVPSPTEIASSILDDTATVDALNITSKSLEVNGTGRSDNTSK